MVQHLLYNLRARGAALWKTGRHSWCAVSLPNVRSTGRQSTTQPQLRPGPHGGRDLGGRTSCNLSAKPVPGWALEPQCGFVREEQVGPSWGLSDPGMGFESRDLNTRRNTAKCPGLGRRPSKLKTSNCRRDTVGNAHGKLCP